MSTLPRVSPAAIPPQPALLRARVVLVDDEPSILRIWEAILAISGYEVQSFLDPVAALRAIATGCDCVITDYHMPSMTGVELIRAARRRTRARFVLMTANRSEAVLEEALSAGATCVFHKPTSPPLVLQQLAKLVSV